MPLGNITSQLFANAYLDKFDKFIKHELKIKYYIRYCDDVVFLSRDKNMLKNIVFKINNFLKNKLKLILHPNKIIIRKYRQGIDFLGYVCFPYHRILRPKTKKRMLKNIRRKMNDRNFNQTLQSYLGTLKHCNSFRIMNKIINLLKN